MFSSYDAAKACAKRARKPSDGRPLWSGGWRLAMRDGDCALTLHGIEVGRYKPDNTFVFTLRDVDHTSVSSSLTATAHANTPFDLTRLSSGRYRVFAKGSDERPEYFTGITYDLTRKAWINARPDLHTLADPERRKEWLRALRKWKRSVKTLARLGVLERIEKDRTLYISGTKDDVVDKLYDMILTGDVSPKSLGLLIGRLFRPSGAPDSDVIYKEIEHLVKSNSFELRKRFGVFGGNQ